MRTGPPTGALPKPNFACVHQPSAVPSGVCFFFLADGCVSLMVMCCDVMWYDVMCLVARLDEVMWLVVR